MDEHREKEADKFRESSAQQQPRKEEAEEEEESIRNQHQEGYKVARNAEEEPTVQLNEMEGGSEEASSLFGIFAHPCSLLQYLLRACADWCWGLHGAFFDDDGPKPREAAAPGAVAPANSTEEQGDGGDQANNYFYMQEVVTRVCAVRRGRPPPGAPGQPREGRGGNGGIHH